MAFRSSFGQGVGSRAGAIALRILSIVFRLAAIAMCALTVILCFSGVSSRLQLVSFVVDLSRTLPDVIAGYGLIPTPFGGVFRLDFACVALVLFVADYVCYRISVRINRGY